jgi:predicted lipoprotein with Yx(FWY)xxD motif
MGGVEQSIIIQSRRSIMKRFAVIAGTAVLGLSALTACGGGGGGYGSNPAPAQNTSSQSTGSQSTGAKLAIADVSNFGKVVVDGNGRTVYVFDKDTASPSKSNCDGDCATMWPPVMAGDGKPQLEGVDASLVGTVTRTDGSKQLTLAGQPLYLFGNDAKAGDAKGQAVGNLWWVVGADGKKITTQDSDNGNAGY